MKLLAIDPASKKLGIAVFDSGELVAADTIEASDTPNLTTRLEDMADNLAEVLYVFKPTIVIIEEPVTKGYAARAIERVQGIIAGLVSVIIAWPRSRRLQDVVYYIKPTSVKKLMGKGTLDKPAVAAAALDMINSETGKALMADLIAGEHWDATDAVAIGLTYYLQYKPEDLA